MCAWMITTGELLLGMHVVYLAVSFAVVWEDDVLVAATRSAAANALMSCPGRLSNPL